MEKKTPDVFVNLAKPSQERLDPDLFAKNNFFNIHTDDPEKGLRSTTGITRLLPQILKIEADPTPDDTQEFIDEMYIRWRTQHPQQETPYDPNSRLERVLEAFDSFMYDRFQDTYRAQIESLMDFSRFAVHSTVTVEPLDKAS